METLRVLLSVAGGVGVLLTLPGTLELFLTTTGALRKRGTSGSPRPGRCRLAVVIPAHNEELLVARCVTSVRASAEAAGGAEIVVVADNCTDATGEQAATAGARVLTRTDPERRGKGFALRYAFNILLQEGIDAFLVIDADSLISPNLVSAVLRSFEKGSSAVQCRYRVANEDASVRTRLMDVAFLAFNIVRPRGRAGWGLSAGVYGNGFALHKDTLERVPFTAESIVEDLEYHLRIVAAGARIDFVDEATVYGEMPEASDAARVQRSRWEGGRLRMIQDWVPRMISSVVRGQWRMLEPLIDLLTLPLGFYVVAACVTALSPVAMFRDYGMIALALVSAYVLVALVLGGRPLRSATALLMAPFYVFWKLTTLDSIISTSRKDAPWVRTTRG